MKTYRFTIQIESSFGTPLVGDTLFGQLCWAVRNRFGDARLNQLLHGYTENQPFAVVSDAMPHGYLLLPNLPSRFWQKSDEDRKVLKKKQWIALADIKQAVENWQKLAKAEKDVMSKVTQNQLHNSIDRQTQTTGTEEGFAPYSASQIWYSTDTQLDLYVVLDENRLTLNELQTALSDIGKLGFGRDASIGLGRFSIEKVGEFQPHFGADNNAYLTLANCAPQHNDLDNTRSFYQITTRFGRHGDMAVFSKNPFKKPIILAKAGAVFTPNQFTPKTFIGNGLANISHCMENAVHQGYAPVVPLNINFE